jgi:hypothetical protein
VSLLLRLPRLEGPVDLRFDAGVARRYAIPVVQAFPDKRKLIHVSGDSGSSVYRRLDAVAAAPDGVQP